MSSTISHQHYRRLGKSPIVVSPIGLGTMIFGTKCSEHESFSIMDKAYNQGVNLFDTAEIYPVPSTREKLGLSEEILGKWLQGKERDSVLISTKISGPAHGWYQSPARSGMACLDERHIIKAVEGSLSRLNTDYIDILQVHWPDHGMNLEDLLKSLDNLCKQGKTRIIGCSNETSWGLMKALWISESKGLKRYEVIQNSYSFNNRRFEDELAQVCLYEEISLLAYAPLSGGVLTGKYNSNKLDNKFRYTKYLVDGKTREKSIAQRYVNEKTLYSAKQFCDIAKAVNVSPTTLGVAWTIQSEFVASALVGASNVNQLDEIIDGVNYQISPDTLSELNFISKKIPYPME